ncbi:MAG: FHA domain-containing protein [Wenzhouxiangellaceae bacterium]|nr:FHA domain-containing protein [Wenzhouxiangellaceae bacterium]
MNYRLKAASGAVTGQAFDLGDETLIGSDAAADIRLDALDAQHARIVQRDGALLLESYGDTAVNGEAVRQQALQSGDELRLGTVRFVLQAPGLKPARVLDRVPESPQGRWKWIAVAALAAAAGGVAWWFLAGPGMVQ